VLVVGAGPAGSMAARVAARAGFTTVVVEESRLDREKPCGGGLTAKLVQDYGPPSDVCERQISQAVVYGPSGRMAAATFGHPVWTAMRGVFDKAMSGRALDAGAEIREETKATAAILRNRRVMGVVTKRRGDQESVHARFTIMADGYPTMLARYFGIYRRTPMSVAACVQRHLEMSESAIEEKIGDRLEAYFGDQVIPRGFAYVFPKRRIVSVGLGTWVETIRQHKIDLWERLDNFIRHHPVASTKLQGSAVKLSQARMVCCSRAVERTGGDGFLLAGDAAAFVSPVAMEGIWYAMKTGEAAGQSAVRALEESQTSDRTMEVYLGNLPARVAEDMTYGMEVRRRFLDTEEQQEKMVVAVRQDKWFEHMFAELINGSVSHKRWLSKLRRHPEKLIKAKLLYR